MNPVFTILTVVFSLKKIVLGIKIFIPSKEQDSICIEIGLSIITLWIRIPIMAFKKMSPVPVVEFISYYID